MNNSVLSSKENYGCTLFLHSLSLWLWSVVSAGGCLFEQNLLLAVVAVACDEGHCLRRPLLFVALGFDSLASDSGNDHLQPHI